MIINNDHEFFYLKSSELKNHYKSVDNIYLTKNE